MFKPMEYQMNIRNDRFFSSKMLPITHNSKISLVRHSLLFNAIVWFF